MVACNKRWGIVCLQEMGIVYLPKELQIVYKNEDHLG